MTSRRRADVPGVRRWWSGDYKAAGEELRGRVWYGREMMVSDNIKRLARRALERCDVLAGFTEKPGRITRTFLSPPMRDVHRAAGEWMSAAGMGVRVDGLGNISGRSAGP